MKEQTAVEWLQIQIDNKDMGEIPMWVYEFIEQAKEMQQEELEKELNRFFLYFRDNGERLLGASIEQLVKSYLKSR
jgi:hypothetical protein